MMKHSPWRNNMERISTPQANQEHANEVHSFSDEITRESSRFDQNTWSELEQALKETHRSLEEPSIRRALEESYQLVGREGSINNQAVHFVGVTHDPETFLFHRGEIERSIAAAGALVVEGAPEIAGVRSPQFMQEIYRMLESQGKTSVESEAWYEKNVLKNPFDEFYHEIEQLAKKYDKPVISIDPDSGVVREPELLRKWAEGGDGDLRELADRIQLGISLGWGTALLAGGGSLAWAEQERQKKWERAVYETHERGEELPKKEAMSRRKVLAGIAGLGAAAVATPTAFSTLSPNSTSFAHAATTFDDIDFRNISVARAIDSLTKRKEFDKPLTFIYGSAHADNLMKYLSYKEFRDTKYELYAPLHKTEVPELAEYRYAPGAQDPAAGQWKKVLSEVLP
ncbi:MAG: hypothetical protein ACREGR_03820 [Minisyncoccia bacterium]